MIGSACKELYLLLTHLILLAILGTHHTHANTNTETPQAKKTLRFAMNENLIEQKVAAALFARIMKLENHNVDIEPVPPSRANRLNLNLNKDGEIARIQTYGEKNPQLFRVEPAYYELKTGVFCRKDETKLFKTKEDLTGYKISTILGVAHSDFITEDLPHVSVVGSAEQMFEMTALGRVDLAIDTSINGLAYLKKSPLKNIKLCGVVKTHKLYVYLNEKSKALAKPLSNRIQQLIKSGELNQWIKEEEKKLLEN